MADLERLKREKTKCKDVITRERNKLYELVSPRNASKNTIRRYISKIKLEFVIIEKILNKMKETFIFENILESEVEVAKIDKEMEEIGN